METATVTSAEAALPVETIEVVPPPPAVTNAAEAGSPVCPIVAAETVVETVVVTVTAEAGAPVGNNLIVTTTIFEKETVYMPAETVFVTVGGENGGRRGGGKKGGQKGGQRGGQRGGNGGRGRGGVEEEEEEDTPTSTSVSVPVAAETAAPVVAAPAVPDFTDGATCTDSVVTVTVKRRAARAAAPTVA